MRWMYFVHLKQLGTFVFQKCVYHTDLGEHIGLDRGVVYVSTDEKATWIPLHEFVKRASI